MIKYIKCYGGYSLSLYGKLVFWCDYWSNKSSGVPLFGIAILKPSERAYRYGREGKFYERERVLLQVVVMSRRFDITYFSQPRQTGITL